jgi:hypothetical protein
MFIWFSLISWLKSYWKKLYFFEHLCYGYSFVYLIAKHTVSTTTLSFWYETCIDTHKWKGICSSFTISCWINKETRSKYKNIHRFQFRRGIDELTKRNLGFQWWNEHLKTSTRVPLIWKKNIQRKSIRLNRKVNK